MRLALFTFSNEISGTIKMDSNCLYSTEGWSDKDRTSLNKVVGFCNGISEDDSGRIAFRCIGGQYWEITTYVHDNGEFKAGTELVLCVLFPDQEIPYTLKRVVGGWKYNVAGKEVFYGSSTVKVAKSWIPKIKLWPYFEGKDGGPADHTMSLSI